MTDQERERISSLNDNMQSKQQEPLSHISATRKVISFQEMTDVFEPSKQLPISVVAPSQMAPLRNE